MECLAVRERLAEYAVSMLPSDERSEVDQHLEWCAGCRKEVRELREAATIVGLSLAPSEPSPELEERVVRRVHAAAGPGRQSRRRTRVRRGVTLLAAVVGILGVSLAGVLFARQQTTEEKLHTSQQQAQRDANRFQGLLEDLRAHGAQPQDISRAVLAPSASRRGGGGALRVTSRSFEDIAVVFVGALADRGLPYRVYLAAGPDQWLLIGRISRLDTGGGATVTREFTANLGLYRSVQVRDARGRLVLSGVFGT